ncbi:MAG: DUF5625 family protein [Methylovulum sp.]|nr:DUF5625 family protein [Methylovulum sp.]
MKIANTLITIPKKLWGYPMKTKNQSTLTPLITGPATPVSSAYEIVTALVLCLLLMMLSGCAVLNPTMPIQIPIDLSKAGSVAEAEFWIPADDSIELCLYFFVNDQPGDSKRLFEVLDPDNNSGITIPLKVQIKKKGNSEIEKLWLDKIYSNKTRPGTGVHYYYRIIDYLTIKPGNYRLRIENMQSFPQLAQNKIEVRAYYLRRK